jgi:hypothetical protein
MIPIPLTDLWLPILVSAAFVFVVSSVIHMVTPMHKGDCRRAPNEDKLLDSLRALGVPPGEYTFPCPASMKECGTPEFKAKFERGPVGYLLIRGGGMGMGKSLLQWFLYSVVVSVFAAYIAGRTLGPLRAGSHDYLDVFRIAGAVATGIYALSNVTNSIWKGVSWGVTLKFVVDGIIYGLVTAGTFGWLWPKGP